MIQIELTTALALYSALICLGALLIWLYTELATYRRQRTLERQNLWRCAFCRYVYLDELAHSVSECPRCRSLNSVTDRLARYVAAPASQPSDKPVEGEEGEPRRNPSRRKRKGSGRRGPRRRR